MENIQSDTRKLLNDIDTLAGQLLEDLEDNYDIENDHQLESLSGELNELQHRITTIQNLQGWLD